ncbi:hypothetical protein OS493_012828 [Desmophyllum pertusum]|uniref:HECT domain-containing protein n=1 Tax=Desmophyllum pertusum TaxID=174260 RepID=A0A9W9Z4M4_9CNID|nr:hypothetical protein OS493_012828 [Desmophyllum pertusum]
MDLVWSRKQELKNSTTFQDAYITQDYARAIQKECRTLIKAMKKARDLSFERKVIDRHLIVGESELKDLLSFCTGVTAIPPMGFDNPSVITVTSTYSTLPNANTRPKELELLSEVSSFEGFCSQMDMAIASQSTGFGVA